MNIPKEILLNQLIRLSFVQSIAKRKHVTGMVNDQSKIDEKVRIINQKLAVSGLDILEIGPGQTFGVLTSLLESGANSIAALDISDYSDNRPKDIKFHTYDGRVMPFGNESYDLICSFSVLEHVRHPKHVVSEMYRVLRPGGKMIHLIDLVDHFNYDWKEADKDFNCLKYPDWLWALMTKNRSNYVNRIRVSGWMSMLHEAGFDTKIISSSSNETIRELWSKNDIGYLKKYTEVDATTRCILVEASK